MNDRLPSNQDRLETITINPELLDGFMRAVNSGKKETFISSFKVLLEQHGFPVLMNGAFDGFWARLSAKAVDFHKPMKANVGCLTQIEAKSKLPREIGAFFEEYFRLFCAHVDKTNPSPVEAVRNGYAELELNAAK